MGVNDTSLKATHGDPNDLTRVKGNIMKMVQQDAPRRDVELYVKSEGYSAEDIRRHQMTGKELAIDKTESTIKKAGEQLPLFGAIGGSVLGNLAAATPLAAFGGPLGTARAGRIAGATLGGGGGELARQQTQDKPIPTAARLTAPALQGLTGLPTQIVTPPQEKPDPGQVGQAALAGAGFGAMEASGELIFSGLKGVWKSRAKEMANRIVPKAVNLIKTSFSKFDDGMQSWFKDHFNAPESVMSTIRTRGFDAVRTAKKKLGGSADDFYKRLRDGVLRREAEAQAAEHGVYKQIKGGRRIDLTSYVEKSLKALRGVQRVTSADKLSPTGQVVARTGNVLDDVFDRMIRLRDATKTGFDLGKAGLSKQQTIDVSRKGLGARFEPKTSRINVNKAEFQVLKDEINRWFRSASGAEKQVLKKVKIALVDAGEDAGLTGLRKADKLYSESIKKVGQFIKDGELKTITKSTLEKWHNANTAVRNKAKDLAKYIGDKNIVDDLDVFHAGKYVDDADNFLAKDTGRKVFTILKGATEGVERAQVQKQLTQMVGEQAAKSIVSDIASFGFWRRAGKVVGGAALFGLARKAGILPSVGGFGDGQ